MPHTPPTPSDKSALPGLWKRIGESPWVWLMPVLVPFVLFMLIPLLEVIRLSFVDWDWFSERYVGFAQYRRLFRNPEFIRALQHTLAFSAAVVPAWICLTLVIATIIAPMANRLRSAWVTLFYLTYLVSPLVLSMVWSWMLDPSREGLINQMLGAVGIGALLEQWGWWPVPWLTSSKFALTSVIISTVFTIPGSGVLLYSAAISTLPSEQFEAATIDGANRFQQWWHVTIPLLKPTTLYLTVIYTIASFQVFERVYIMTGGGPAGSTTVLVEQIYNDAFRSFNFGAASAQAVILLLMIAGIASVQFATLKGEVQY